jgi:uncharacterized protein YpmS
MKFVRWFFAVLFSIVFSLAVFLAIPLCGVSTIVKNSDTVKTWIDDSGLYTKIGDLLPEMIPSFLEDSKEDNEYMVEELEDENSELSIAVNNLLDPETLKTNTEEAVDGLYAWLRGDTDYPVIDFALIENRDDLEDVLVATLKVKIENLPVCSSVSSSDTDFYDMKCRPSDLDMDSLEQTLRKEFSSSEEVQQMMDSMRFQTKAEDFNAETTQKAQRVYQIITYLPAILISLFLILLAVIMLLIPGFKTKFVFPGIQIILNSITWILVRFITISQLGNIVAGIENQVYVEGNEAMNSMFSSSMSGIFRSILEDVLARVGLIAFISLGVGIVLIILGSVLKPKEEESESKEEKTEKIEKEKKD